MALVPSGTNLLGLLNHVTAVERWIFLRNNVIGWPAAFRADPGEPVAEVGDRHRTSVQQANAARADRRRHGALKGPDSALVLMVVPAGFEPATFRV